MMDFIVSRVVMSVCALLVAGVLAGLVDVPRSQGLDDQLEDIASDLCRTMERVAGSNADVDLAWIVQSLPSGESVAVRIDDSYVAVGVDGHEAFARPSCDIHLWEWDGSVLNRSAVDALDSASGPLQASSGDRINLRSITVDLEGFVQHMLFVRSSG